MRGGWGGVHLATYTKEWVSPTISVTTTMSILPSAFVSLDSTVELTQIPDLDRNHTAAPASIRLVCHRVCRDVSIVDSNSKVISFSQSCSGPGNNTPSSTRSCLGHLQKPTEENSRTVCFICALRAVFAKPFIRNHLPDQLCCL